MANKKISELTSVVPTGDEELVVASDGDNYKTTVDDVADYTDDKISSSYAHKSVDSTGQEPEGTAGDIFVNADNDFIEIKNTNNWVGVATVSRLPSVLTQEEYEEQKVLHPERATDGVVRFRYYEEVVA